MNGTVTVRRQERAHPPIPSTPRRQMSDPCNKAARNPKFESSSLQQRVRCELDPVGDWQRLDPTRAAARAAPRPASPLPAAPRIRPWRVAPWLSNAWRTASHHAPPERAHIGRLSRLRASNRLNSGGRMRPTMMEAGGWTGQPGSRSGPADWARPRQWAAPRTSRSRTRRAVTCLKGDRIRSSFANTRSRRSATCARF